MILELLVSAAVALGAASPSPKIEEGIKNFTPSQEELAARQRFGENRLGIFIHWGVYSMLGRGEWVMDTERIPFSDYSMLPGGFYPSKFNAAEWVSAIKGTGAKYITITSRHHDGFSMFATKQSPYNIVDATPFGRDVLKELADECQKQGITHNFYYSLIDWGREDYPFGRDGNKLGKDPQKADFAHYLDFMCAQITELLTNYGPIGCIWFDGDWDRFPKPAPGEETKVDFDWGYERIYTLIHKLQPGCLVANNHHRINIPGEDVQLFERDVPGEDTAGYSRTSYISDSLPLETCQTMNKSWGFDIKDHKFKTGQEIIRTIIRTAGRNANLLLNIGPQPDGQIPATSLERFKEMGAWMQANGETIYATHPVMKPQPWGVTTAKDGKIWLHVMEYPEGGVITLPMKLKAKTATVYGGGQALKVKKTKDSFTVTLPESIDCSLDYIIEIR
ncbi:MAG: alpha-L-fucosidase [Bacteroidales bacterium]|nr:alpha-L-fucosidase [Candidatus Cryptobacteroides equifaecalis]